MLYEKFQELLRRDGKTAYRVAKDTGVSTATLTSWKKGRYKPKVDKLQILADYFDVNVDHFLS
ncbi:helix-turn-helix domain-containing protein [Paenibacillus macerans]|uniref:helix-turn-helix domain-containing protein n=1 Tax=Paenibacillus macerans TaxID=44252 RepID=UPI003D3112CC